MAIHFFTRSIHFSIPLMKKVSGLLLIHLRTAASTLASDKKCWPFNVSFKFQACHGFAMTSLKAKPESQEMYGHKWWLCWKISVQCGRELNFLHSVITVIILHGEILILYNWRPYLSITPRSTRILRNACKCLAIDIAWQNRRRESLGTNITDDADIYESNSKLSNYRYLYQKHRLHAAF